jgi:class 3 adenylate cyclase
MSDLPGCSHDPTGIHPFEAREHMNNQWSSHLETLSLTEIIRLQNQLSEVVTRRFERPLALCFSDIVGSTQYFARFGDEAGQRLQQQHVDLLSEALTGTDGRIIHTAGDGALLAFSQVESAVDTIVKFRVALWKLSCRLSAEQQWTVRSAIHWGPVLTDGAVIAGDTVNLCSKITSATKPGAILLSKPAFSALPVHLRNVSRSIGMITLVNPANSMELFRLSWHELLKWPILILIEETGERIFLPDQPVISIGRLSGMSGTSTNDIVLKLPDEHLTSQISRWHLELRRQPSGFVVYSLSDKPTHIDGQPMARGESRAIMIGTKIRLSNVITLQLLSSPHSSESIETALSAQPSPATF